MSLRVITIVWDRYPEGGSKLLAMVALADWAGDDGGRLYPSVAGLAAKIRMSERQTKRILEGLINDGYLELLTKGNAGGRRKSNRYRIKLETLTNCPVIRGETQPFDAPNHDNLSINSDIAMSDEPLEPIKPLLTPRPGSIDAKIDNQRRFIETLRRGRATEAELQTHADYLEALILERDGPQQTLLEEAKL